MRQLFDRALELPAPARADFLDDACRGDADLKRAGFAVAGIGR